jgi:SIR2-like domain
MVANIVTFKHRITCAGTAVEKKTMDHFTERVNNLCSSPPRGKAWSRYKNFWPPTIIKALRDRNLIFFMGAGTSAAAKLPTWREMLELRFGVPAPFLADDNLKNDNLTLGEIASRLIGREQLQSNLRSIYNDDTILPTVIHYGLAALELPIYMTTNYDVLFEKAWKAIFPGKEIAVICNSTDLNKNAAAPYKLFKLHGCASRKDELLVLTRSEYRQNYRRAVAELVGIEGGVVSGVINLESSGVEASDRRPRHDDHYHEA